MLSPKNSLQLFSLFMAEFHIKFTFAAPTFVAASSNVQANLPSKRELSTRNRNQQIYGLGHFSDIEHPPKANLSMQLKNNFPILSVHNSLKKNGVIGKATCKDSTPGFGIGPLFPNDGEKPKPKDERKSDEKIDSKDQQMNSSAEEEKIVPKAAIIDVREMHARMLATVERTKEIRKNFFKIIRGSLENAQSAHAEHWEIAAADHRHLTEIVNLYRLYGDLERDEKEIVRNATNAALALGIFDEFRKQKTFCSFKVQTRLDVVYLDIGEMRAEFELLNLIKKLEGKHLAEKMQKFVEIIKFGFEFYEKDLLAKEWEINSEAKEKIEKAKEEFNRSKIFFTHLTTILDKTDDLREKKNLTNKMLKELLQSASHCDL